ncbi:MAG TPA: beta-galactosidase GalB [Pyrinomonadaceae bacterium]|nr:beta-galactosidase GalB [Pyrinomonadaceae bacterium]
MSIEYIVFLINRRAVDVSPTRYRGWFCLTLAACGLFLFAGGAAAQGSPRSRVSFNAGWRFQKDDPAGAEGRLSYEKIKESVTATGREFVAGASKAVKADESLGADVSYTRRDFDDSAWRRLDLPHDWGVEGPFRQEYPGETGKLPWWGVGWYRKHFDVPAGDKGKQIYLDIDGAMSYATVWLNGRFVGGWPYGYSSFQLDLTPFVEYGKENVVAIRLDNPPDSSRWYPGGGIYRNVWLTKTAPVHVAHWGTYVTTPEVSPRAATVNVEVTLANDSGEAAEVEVETAVFTLDPDWTARGVEGVATEMGAEGVATETARLGVGAGTRARVAASVRVNNPRLWSPKSPNLYLAITTVGRRGRILDVYPTVFGIRTVKFDAARGLLVNGEVVEIKGVCNHHDLGALGAAVNWRALQRQLEILKEMGVNAIRTSHNPPAPELLDLADRMGLLVADEAFDAWRRAKKKNDYHLLFDDWHEKDLRALVRRDRNHPSVMLWSTGNEIGEQGNAEGHKLSEELSRIVREEDPTRPVTAGANHVQAGYNGFQKTLDVFGYNYKPQEYAKFREKNPAQPLYGSETSSTVSSRGEYFFPVEEDKDRGKADFQVSSYDLYAPRWATTPDAEFKGQDENPSVAGEFVWTGFDYLGEPTPYNADASNLLNFSDPAAQARMAEELKALGKIRVPSRSSYFGIVDLAGFKKDRFYIYQARWRPELPMAHILPHWNWPGREGQVTPVHVYTSGDEAELFLNRRSLGRKKRGPFEYRLRWDEVKYEPGELRVVAYREGRRWAEDYVRTTGPAARLLMNADRAEIAADGSDLSFVTVSVADGAGLTVPRAKNRVRFEVLGPGEIVAVDNGDPTSHEPFQSKERAAYNGLCLVVVRSKAGAAGSIKLRAYSEGLKSADVTIKSRRAR